MGIRGFDLCQIGGYLTGCLFLDGFFTTKHTKGHEVVYNVFRDRLKMGQSCKAAKSLFYLKNFL